ncbi:FAD-dependent oxidoreductase [Terrimonas sp. NA20]|uniref:FAD-dependent oxidoreductase n=1 Tax=Terrimonas ginsenosidimutans TaxID=2908004 RepID=A0ABS9L0P7_9BACT|nr:FAD-dependent oxidoreductase [Terrimonas ginsenosidimutans]MCG2618151.1 FAD-dependent oxidoreductase [Terrimonas ginsenosidimutans]
MQKNITLKLLPGEAANEATVRKYIARAESVRPADITGYNIQKRSIDARGRQAWINLTVQAFINEPFHNREIMQFDFLDVSHAANSALIIGAGPAGLFAALEMILRGVKPILLERGKDVRARRRDLAALNKEGEVNPESNYCFGEGGAGTYSDGKLYTRSSKRGDIARILNLFVHFGAEEKILYEAHPHIGTNKLPQIITAMRETIRGCGGQFLFEKKVTDLIIENNEAKGVQTSDGDIFKAQAVILATGHSARDIFELLHRRQILIEAKPFALGVRVEHPQSLIDQVQYHTTQKDELLPPASYSLVQQVEGQGVFSFCMCPGGIIAPAATSPGELVVNGWSPSKRNNPFANSGIVVTVSPQDAMQFLKKEKIAAIENDPLLLMKFQQRVEQKAFLAGGGKFVAPAQRMADFSDKKVSSSLPECSYLPGLHSSPLQQVLPSFVHSSLQQAFREFGKKMRGYFTNDAVVVATESRTSSPVRIPRNADTLEHPQIKRLFPCAEGAGYAGGIVSAAMDGERVAKLICELLK